MSVLSCIEQIGEAREADEDKDGYQLKRIFYVAVNSDADDGVTAKSGALSYGLPAAFSDHPNESNSKLVNYQVEESGKWLYKITCNYSSNKDDQGEGKDDSGNPTNNPMDVRFEYQWDSKEVEIPVLKDLANVPAVNAAGDRFDPPVMRKVYRRLLTVVLNSASFDSTVIQNYVGHCNSAVWNGIAAKRVLITSIKTSPAEKNGVFYDKVSVTFEILHSVEDDWTPTKILNAGMRKKVGANFQLIEIGTPPENYPVNAPVPLKADGSGAIDATDPPNYIELDLIPTANFAALPAAISF